MLSFVGNQQWIKLFWLSWVGFELCIIVFKNHIVKDETLGTDNRKEDYVKKFPFCLGKKVIMDYVKKWDSSTLFLRHSGERT